MSNTARSSDSAQDYKMIFSPTSPYIKVLLIKWNLLNRELVSLAKEADRQGFDSVTLSAKFEEKEDEIVSALNEVFGKLNDAASVSLNDVRAKALVWRATKLAGAQTVDTVSPIDRLGLHSAQELLKIGSVLSCPLLDDYEHLERAVF